MVPRSFRRIRPQIISPSPSKHISTTIPNVTESPLVIRRQSKYRQMYRLIEIIARGVLPNKEVGGGGLDLTSSLEAKFGARSGQVHQIRLKIWEVLSPQDTKVGKSPNFGVISEIQRAKFGVFVIYIFGGKIWCQAPRPPNMEAPPPPGDNSEKNTNVCVTSAEPEFTLNHEGFKEFPWEYSHLPRKFIMPIPCFNSCFHFHLQA